MTKSPLRYHIEVLLPDQLSRKVEVIDQISAGLDPRCDLVIVDRRVKSRHLLFQKREDVLTVKLQAQSPTYLNNHLMEKDRNYVIDHDDIIEAGKVTFHILGSLGDKPLPSVRPKLHSLPQLEKERDLEADSEAEEKTEKKAESIAENPVEVKIPVKKQPAVVKTTTRPIMLHLLVMALLVDFFLTYLLVSFLLIIPETIYPLEKSVFAFHSPLSLLIVTLLVRGAFALLTGKTPAEWMLGLTYFKKNFYKRFILFTGLSMAERKNENYFFSFMRKFGFLFIILWCLIAPFFLPAQYRLLVSRARENTPLQKALNTRAYSGKSKDFKIAFSADIPTEYVLYPVYSKNALPVFELVHLESKQKLKLETTRVISHDLIFKTLKFANPLSSKLSGRTPSMKERLIEALTISPLNSANIIATDGPFIANQFALKGLLLKDFPPSGDILLDEYGASSPLLKLTQDQHEEVILIAPEKILFFRVHHPGPVHHGLNLVVHHALLSQFYWIEDELLNQQPAEDDLLSLFDELKRGNITALWTYYSFEARKLIQNSGQNKSAGVLATESRKQSLLEILTAMENDHRNETVAKSVAEIKKLLTDPGYKTNDRKSSGPKNVRKQPNIKTKNPRRR